MTKQGSGGSRIAYLVAIAVVFVWGILGVADMSNATYTGYTTTPQNVVNQVEPGSPADQAGFMVDDEIVSIAGVPVEDSRSMNRLPRVLPGATREIAVNRGGQQISLMLTYAGQPGSQRVISWIGIIIGFLFLFMPFLASRSGSAAGQRLGWAGVCFGLAFLPGPYVSSVGLRNLVGTITLTVIVLGFAALLRFVLSYPTDRLADAKSSTKLLLWGPAVLIALLFAYLFLAEPDSTSGLNSFVNLLVGLFVIGYFGGALVVLIRTYMAASPEAKSSTGLSLMFWGAIIGMLPVIVSSIMNLLAPMLVLPGQQYWFIALGLIPITFSLAVMGSKASPETATA